jgi:zinc D-Ala-D-Ala carboxypeptidase
MQLSPHFEQAEFELDAPLPAETVPTYQAQCKLQLEPIRAQFNAPVTITSGYRTPASNQAAHGVQNSQHCATAAFCASDFRIQGLERDMRPAFDWIRQNAELPFDQVILEHNPEAGTDIVHISYSTTGNRREALEGETANQTAYKNWPSAPTEQEQWAG